MKIYCPKCHTCYSIDDNILSKKGKKLRCDRCGEVWIYSASNTEQTPPQNIIPDNNGEITTTPSLENEAPIPENDMDIIFSRLKDETNKIDTEINQLSTIQKNLPKLKKLLGWDKYSTIFFEFLILLIIICLSLFAARFEIVRQIPQAETFYDSLGIPSRVIGEGLEFQNIVRDYNDKENPQLLRINGFIFNTTEKELEIPTILINIFNEDATEIQQIPRNIEEKSIAPQAKIAFNFKINVPVEAKYILLTFTK